MDTEFELQGLDEEEMTDTDPPDKLVRGEDNPLVIKDIDLFATNIADQMTKKQLSILGKLVVEDAEEDLRSREDDMQDRWDRWAKLYVGRPEQGKFSQRVGSPNIHCPDTAVAVDQFSARAEKYLFPSDNIAKAEGTGLEDKARAFRVEKCHNVQLETRIRHFRRSGGQGVKQTALFGSSAWKLWWDPADNRPAFKVVPPEDFIVSYTHSGPLESAQRLTERLYQTRDYIRQLVKDEVYHESCWDLRDDKGDLDEEEEGTANTRQEVDGWSPPRNASEDGPMEVFEQHRMLDLEGTGIGKPFVVTVHRESRKVMRVVYRKVQNRQGDEEQIDFYSNMELDYNPLGFYSLGIGAKVEGLNIAKNSFLNLTIYKGIRDSFPPKFCSKNAFKSPGDRDYELDEWIEAEMFVDDLSKAMFIPPTNPISPVLMTGYSEAGRQIREVVSVTDIMQGKEQPHNQAAFTTKAVREESLELFNGSFRRMLNGLTDFLQKLYKLNRIYLSDEVYNEILGDTGQEEYIQWQQHRMQWEQMVGAMQQFLQNDMQPPPELIMQMQQLGAPREFPFSVEEDFADTIDLIPTADPHLTSEQERIAVGEAVLNLVMPDPAADPHARWAAKKAYLEALRVPASLIAQVNPEPQQPEPPPNKDQRIENADALRGQPMHVLPDQNHQEHIDHITAFRQERAFLAMSPEGKEALAQHEREHWAMIVEQEAQRGQQLSAPGGGPQAGAPAPSGIPNMGPAPGSPMLPS